MKNLSVFTTTSTRLLSISLFCVTAACGGSKSSGLDAQSAPAPIPNHQIYEGEYAEFLDQIAKSDNVIDDACDKKEDPMLREVLLALMQNKAKIIEQSLSYKEKNGSATGTQATYVFHTLKEKFSLYLDRKSSNSNSNADSTFNEEPFDITWTKLHKMLSLTNFLENEHGWYLIDREARSLMTSDYNRRIALLDKYIHPKDIDSFVSIIPKAKKCLSEGCPVGKFLDTLNLKERELVTKHPALKPEILDSTDEATDQQIIYGIHFYIQRRQQWEDSEATGGHKIIVENGKKKLRAIIDGSEMSDSGRNITKTVLENFWKNSDLELQIQWKDQDLPDFSPYKFLLQLSGGRAFVDHSKKEINLFNPVSEMATIHEFGHVLGLPDRYYEIRNMETCEYSSLSNPNDIMSGPTPTSLPLAKDWDFLLRAYR